MKLVTVLLICGLTLFTSCKKNVAQKKIVGEWIWTIQYSDNPAYNSTPQSTGVRETLSFNRNGDYALTQNGIVTNTGTYRLSTAKSINGQNVSSIYYSNSRLTDSVAYYLLQNNNDSLIFSHDLIGTVGSGSRHYGRQ